jgi:uncharacterized protein YndB with AHSA1/START domain
MAPIKEVKFERVYDAPIALVWQAWTDPKMLPQWWGPDNVTIPECDVDLRVGGTIHIVMEAGEAMGPYKGTRWPMVGQFTVVQPTTHLAYHAKAWTEGEHDTTEIDQVTEVTLAEHDGKTIVTVTAAILKIGPGAKMAVEGIQHGFTQQLDKLTAFLAARKA